ncbi:hypothetical protein [Rhizobium sp. RM]|uniref:LysE family translocator n=1 Tax=Rhizobium sp. RM TaxID=2748079 RepID=UPI001FEFAFAF|nr:hypothetical protein [Rhizobium sp. RM]
MSSYSVFALAALALLLTPGPTNTLLALSGAGRGVKASLPLMLGEIAGYLLVILSLVLLVSRFLEAHAGLASAIKLCAAVWVAFLAVRLWSLPPSAPIGEAISVRRVFVTTCLNPKALIVGLVLLPQARVAEVWSYILLFSLLVAFAALAWLCAGAFLIRHAGQSSPRLVRGTASCFLLVLSLGLAGNVFGIL